MDAKASGRTGCYSRAVSFFLEKIALFRHIRDSCMYIGMYSARSCREYKDAQKKKREK